MYNYIKIDENFICVGYKSITTKIEDKEYIYIGKGEITSDILYRKYDIENRTFSAEKYCPAIEEVPTLDDMVKEQGNKISILEAENETLKQELSITQDAVNELIFNSLNI